MTGNPQQTLEQARKFVKLLKPMFDLVDLHAEGIDIERQRNEAQAVLETLRKNIAEATERRDGITGETRAALAKCSQQIDRELSEAKDRAQAILSAAERDAQATLGQAVAEAVQTKQQAQQMHSQAQAELETARQLTASQEARKVELAKDITAMERQRDALRTAISKAMSIGGE